MAFAGRNPSLYEIILAFISLFLLIVIISAKNQDADNLEEKWKKKDVRDYTDADIERLFDQWEENDDPLPDDELPEWKRDQPKIDLSQINPNDPEGMLQATKKGKTLMMFASVSGNPTEAQTQEITQIWQSSLFNAHYETQRYVVGDNRVLFMLKDGSKAWEIKDFLVTQDRCEVVTIEGKDYYGKGHPSYEDPEKIKQEHQKKKSSKPKKKKVKKEKVRKEENEIYKEEEMNYDDRLS